MDLSILVIVVALIALVSPVLMHFMHKVADKEDSVSSDVSESDRLDAVSKYIYSLDDPDVLRELSILTDVRRLLLHLERTEGSIRIG